MRLSAELSNGEVIRVFGPARLTVLKGRVMILGAYFDANESVEIDRYRSYAVKAVEDSLVEIRLEESGSIERPVEGEEVLEEWVSIADEIVSAGGTPLAVALGPVDAGKSSFTALLANRALHRGLKPGIIDADIGQADIGPPGFVSASLVDRKILWLRWLRPWKLRFIGAITPQRFEKRIIAAVLDLKHLLRQQGADLVAVDTDGWVHGLPALEYKMELVRNLRPTHIVVINDDELYNVASRWGKGGIRVYKLRSPSVVYERSREDRRLLRSAAYSRFFEGAAKRKISLTEVTVYGSCLLSGRLLEQNEIEQLSKTLGVRVIRASETLDTLFIVTEGQPRQAAIERLSHERNVYILQAGEERGLYIAVLGEDMEEVAPGVILGVDYSTLEAEILTSYTGDIRGIVIGNIKLNVEQGFVEEGRTPRCPI